MDMYKSGMLTFSPFISRSISGYSNVQTADGSGDVIVRDSRFKCRVWDCMNWRAVRPMGKGFRPGPVLAIKNTYSTSIPFQFFLFFFGGLAVSVLISVLAWSGSDSSRSLRRAGVNLSRCMISATLTRI